MKCSLCSSKTSLFSKINNKEYYSCNNCKAISLHPNFFVSPIEEKKRYELHNNDVNDLNYQNYFTPLKNYIKENFNKQNIGLDFGSGKASVISKLLEKERIKVYTYDPFFNTNEKALSKQYDFIICNEVVEHFNNPYVEFERINLMLKDNGQLICRTQLFSSEIDFKSWWYRNDKTHVFFYQKQTFEWIQNHFKFTCLKFHNNLIIIQK